MAVPMWSTKRGFGLGRTMRQGQRGAERLSPSSPSSYVKAEKTEARERAACARCEGQAFSLKVLGPISGLGQAGPPPLRALHQGASVPPDLGGDLGSAAVGSNPRPLPQPHKS